jgi:hypothetical protein
MYVLVSKQNVCNYVDQPQGDGDLVILDSSGAVVWRTDTADSPGGWLEMQTDGNLVLKE